MQKQLLTAVIITVSLFSNSSLVQGSETDIYNLCSKFPLNSKCKGYEAPIPLKSRPGNKAQCLFSSQEKPEKCKVNITDELITFYLETGEGLAILDNDKDTKELIVPLTTIQSFSYSEKKKTDIGAVLAFGVWGLFAKKKTSTFNFRLKPEETNEETIIPKQAVFLVQRNLGREMRQNIEEKIGLAAEILDIE